MTATDPGANPAHEDPECKLKPSPNLADAIRAIRQEALDQFLDMIDARILHLVQNNPYLTTVNIGRDQLIAVPRPIPFVPHTIHQWIRDPLLKHFKDLGIEMLVAGVGSNWTLNLTLPAF